MDPKIWDLVRADARYPYEAYEFVCDAVTFTQQRLGRADRAGTPDDDRHVTGAELARGACDLAVKEFGMMAPVVFRAWNLTRTDDVGEMVFNLIKAERLSKSDRDDPDDFRDLFDVQKTLADGFELTTADYAPRKGDR